MSSRVVALMVYALVVNAVIWASVPAVAGNGDRLCVAAGQQISPTHKIAHDHTCCDVACAVQSTLTPPISAIVHVLPPAVQGARATVIVHGVLPAALPPQARAPPLV